MFRKHFTQSFFKKLPITFLFFLLGAQAAFSQGSISGKITKPDNEPMQNLTVVANGTQGIFTGLTDAQGNYQINLPYGGDYVLAPYQNNNFLNGVSTLDMVQLDNHLNGIQPFDSPFKIIAADLDNSQVVDSADRWQMRLLMLGITLAFPNNTSWRFVDADFVFPNPGDPFASSFPEMLDINNFTADITGADFIAVKVGDVNYTAFGNLSPDTTYLAKIKGSVFDDENSNCQKEGVENPLENWVIVATGDNGTFHHVTGSSGEYSLFVPAGEYDVFVAKPNHLWQACTDTIYNLQAEFPGTATANFPMKSFLECPFLEVDLATGGLPRCFDGTYLVKYCNTGTAAAENAYVEVTLDSFMTNVTTSIPPSSIIGNTYTFPVGDVASGDCGVFQIWFQVSCEAEMGQTHCSSAHIFPDEICGTLASGWNGATLLVNGECEGNEVIFTVTNIGEDMDEPVKYVVIEDVMIQMQQELQLQGGAFSTYSFAANGSTWRLEVKQPEQHPYAVWQSDAVEGCGTNTGGGVSLGFVTQFPLGDEAPFFEEDCQENVGAFDPNDKQGFPKGVGEEHFIEQNRELEYLIRFQNTGTDTATFIAIVDTISALLDPTSFRPGASSHPYQFALSGNGIVQFFFNQIMLPDSNVNEPASHGFIKFKISQQRDLPIGTVVENEASIYFDFNEPVITNRTKHTIGKDFLQVNVSSTEVFVENVQVEVFPNPFQTTATLRLEGLVVKDGSLKIYDGQGRAVLEQKFSGREVQLDGRALSAGMYFFKVEAAGKAIASGKLVVKN